MRSHADATAARRGGRGHGLWLRTLRLAGAGAVVLWILNALVTRTGAATAVWSGDLGDALPRLTVSGGGVMARLDHAPSARERDWLAAIADAGSEVEWTGDVAPVALETYPAADPAGGTFMLVSAPERASVADELGPIDTIEAGGGPGMIRVGDVRGGITLASGGETARAAIGSVTPPKRVVVAGSASWEAKFLIAALEEAGWHVDARLRVRPDEVVVQGGGFRLDTATHSAIVLVDTTVAIAGIDAFVRAGGGLLLAGAASASRAFAPLLGWRVARRETAPLGTLPGDTLWHGQSRVIFGEVDTTRAIILEERGGAPVIVARRHYGGRVLAVGYDDTWRWRMAGGANSDAEHRSWWSHHVASVALRGTHASRASAGAAPLAALYSALGAPASAAGANATLPRGLLDAMLGAIALAALLAEWLLRRLRGRP